MDWESSIKGYRAYMMLERSLSENTVLAYLGDVRRLCEFLQSTDYFPGPDEISISHLTDFVKWLNEVGMRATTQSRIISSIRSFYKYLLLEELIDADPSELLEVPRISRTLPQVLSYNEIQQIIESIDLSHPQGTRNRAIIEILYACGLRVSELVNLRLTDVFIDQGYIRVIGKGNKERLIPIGGEAIKHLRLYLENDRRKLKRIARDAENIIFLNRYGRQLTRVMVFTIIKQAAANTGIKKKVSPHTFRHSFATHLVEGGANLRAVQDMLGHESIITTEIYTHLDTEFLRDTIMQYHPRNRNKS